MTNSTSALSRAFGELWRLFSAEQQEQEMAWAIERYENCKRLQDHLTAAIACQTKREKRALYEYWQLALPPEEVTELVRILKNKPALHKILAWQLVDPRH